MEQMKNQVGKNMISFDIDREYYEEIKSILAKNGRPDLIQALKESRDDDYKPTQNHKKIKEFYEYYEGSEQEAYTSSDVSIDSEGFWSLK